MERVRRREAYQPRKEEEQSPPLVAALSEAVDAGSTRELAPDANVQVISGASVQTLALAGMRISQARALVGTILRIDSRSTVLVNGQPVRPDYRLVSGDTLEFVHYAGEKGGVHGAVD